MKHTLIILIVFFLSACGFKSKVENHSKAQKESDFIIENFTDYELIKDKLPKKYFDPQEIQNFISSLKYSCDWQNRDGKFVDFYSMKNIGGVDQTAFIYEYFLDCDSLRVILIYNMEDSLELFKINLEPLEKENPMIINPSKQLIPK